jgi:hypothetical protein
VDRDATGLPQALRLGWVADRPVHRDLTGFAQVLDGSGRLLAQVDQRPRRGAWPTDAWPPGRPVTDTLRFDGGLAGWDRVIVGWYGPDLARVPLATGTLDHAVLATREGSP